MARECLECGGDLPKRVPGKAGRKPSKFCHRSCRRAFHQRRASRGAIVYDLVMSMRKFRANGATLGDLFHQASIYLNRDKEDGRQSFLDYTGEPIPWVFPEADPMTPRKAANDG